MVICPRCGRETPAATAHCEFCGAELLQRSLPPVRNPFAEASPYQPPLTPPQPPAARPAGDAGLRLLIPIGRSPYAIAAGYAGLLSLGFWCLGPIALLLGVLAVLDIRKHPERVGLPCASVGIVCGALACLALLAIVLAVALNGRRL